MSYFHYFTIHLKKQNQFCSYKNPFSNEKVWGKSVKVDHKGSRAKDLIYWCKDSNEKDTQFIKSSGSKIAPVQESVIVKKSSHESKNIYEILGIPLNTELTEMKNCLSHISSLRLQLKKRDSDSILLQLKDQFDCIDEVTKQTDKTYTKNSIGYSKTNSL